MSYPAPAPPFIAARYKGGSQTPKAIVMHGTVSSDNPGTARNIARWWNGPTSPKSSCHYVVDPKETIQCVGDHTVAFHCGYNTGSIGVELCDEQAGPAARWADTDSTAIIKRAARLVAELCLAYDIEPVRPSIAALKAKGPHGIYGHDDSRRAFGRTTHTDPRDFPWEKFMQQIRQEIVRIKAGTPPKPPTAPADDTVRLRIGHLSGFHGLTPRQHSHDAETAFGCEFHILGGTEATPFSSGKYRDILRAAAAEHGYWINVGGMADTWMAFRRDVFVPGTWKAGYEKVLDRTKAHSEKGITWGRARHKDVGLISAGAAHLLTLRMAARRPRDQREYVDETSEWAELHGRGAALAFVTADGNTDDRTGNALPPREFTTSWDDVGRWPNTGHRRGGDFIARRDADTRVSKAAVARNYPVLHLFSDHNLISAAYDIKKIGTAA